jgi:hypothetical protein
MNELMVAERATHWHRLKALVLDSVSSPITRRVYNLGLDEFIAWFTLEPRPAGLAIRRSGAYGISADRVSGSGSVVFPRRIARETGRPVRRRLRQWFAAECCAAEWLPEAWA